MSLPVPLPSLCHPILYILKIMDHCLLVKGFSGGSAVKNPPASARGVDSIPGLGKSLEKLGNCNPLQDSCLENSTDIAAWWATVHGVAKSQI